MTVQLHLAAYRLMFDHTETARLARDLAVMLEELNLATAGRRRSQQAERFSTGNTLRRGNDAIVADKAYFVQWEHFLFYSRPLDCRVVKRNYITFLY